MAIKFPLEMKDGVQVRNITDLKENFDVEKVVGYFLNGKLISWLEARYYEEEAEAVSKLDSDDSELAKKLCKIFDVEYECEEEIDAEEIFRQNERMAKLKQYTDDSEILENIDDVVFEQEELADLYDKGTKKIYLCEGNFFIPKSKQEIEYVLIGEPVVEGLEKAEEAIPKEESSYFDNYNYNEISEELADIIGLRPFVSTDDYIVFYDEFSGQSIFNDEVECFVVCNKRTNEMSPLHISGYDSKWTKFIGATGNKIFLGAGDILLYNLDDHNCRIVATDVSNSGNYCFSVEQEKAVYVDRNQRLLLYDVNSHRTFQIAEHVSDAPVALVDDKVFYEGYITEDNDHYFCVYEIDSKKRTKLSNARELRIEQMISYNEILYILGYNVWNETVQFLGLNIDDLEEKYTEFFRFHWKSSSQLRLYVERSPYFVFIKAESGFPMFVFDMETEELIQVASGCGYTIKKAYYTNENFQVVGDFLYLKKGADYSNQDEVYRINLLKLDGELIVGKTVNGTYYKNNLG